MRLPLLLLSLFVVAAPASAQVDISGEWTSHSNEDQPHRAPGPELGDYVGLPINDAARQKAETWDALVISQPERQAQPHSAQYSSRGPGPNLRITKITDPKSQTLIGYSLAGYYGRADRTIWLDGRKPPSEKYGEHTWAGFSLGRWEGDRLVVTTTHLKIGVYQRNGVPASPYARMVETYVRHGDMMTMIQWIDDPIYLEEPMMWTQSWDLNPRQFTGKPQTFEPVEEVADKPRGWVPVWPLGTHHPEFGERYGLPFEATLGGRVTMYPEYAKELERLKAQTPRPQTRQSQ